MAGGGHSQYDPDVQHAALLEATDRMHGRLADAGPAPTHEARRRTPVHAHASARDDEAFPVARGPVTNLFVLVQTRHPGNVGAAARALLTMGFDELASSTPRTAGC